MANFYPWIDTANDNVMSVSDFADDAQRKSGFQAGQAASSIRVNSGLRQANLFVAALAEVVLASNTSLNLTSSVTALANALRLAHPFNLKLWNKGLIGGLIGNSDTNSIDTSIGTNSTTFGDHNTVALPQSFVAGAYNISTRTIGVLKPIFQLGTYLTNAGVSTTKFVTGQFNKDCGACVRETGNGTSEATRKTIEKLDDDGNLYVKSVHLSDNISETDDVDDSVLTKTDLLKLVHIVNPLKIQANDGVRALSDEEIERLREGTAQVFGVDGSVAYFTEKNAADTRRSYITFDGGLANTAITNQIFVVDFTAKTISRTN